MRDSGWVKLPVQDAQIQVFQKEAGDVIEEGGRLMRE